MKVLDQINVLACLAAAALPAVNAVTLASTTTLACPPVAATSPTATLVCAKTGDVNGAKRKSIRTFKSKSTPLGDDCLTECLKDTTCLSYSYDSNASKTECRLMLKTVAEQVFTPGSTGITWWDRGCWAVPTSCSNPVVPTTSAKPIVCNRDNVLRALYGKGDEASSFCSSYTKTVATAGQVYPAYLTAYSTTSERISSACTCLSVSPLTTSTTSTTSSAPEVPQVPEDPGWTSTYTWTEAVLPTFTSFPPYEDNPVSQPPFPATTQTDSLPPAYTPVNDCIFDPLAAPDTKYELFMYGPDEASNDFIVADDMIIKLLGDPNFATEEEANAWSAPLFRLSRPATSSLYDIIIETPQGNRYLGYDPTNGNILVAALSSGPATEVPSIGDVAPIRTTAFIIGCDGKIELVMDSNRVRWGYRAENLNLYGYGAAGGDLIIKATPKPPVTELRRRGKGNWGGNPRCPNLANAWASTRGGAPGAYNINNCGEGYTQGIEDGGFYYVRITCQDLHRCYSDCGRTWEECNTEFYDRGHGLSGDFRCRSLNWKNGSQGRCFKVISDMTEHALATVTMVAVSAMASAPTPTFSPAKTTAEHVADAVKVIWSAIAPDSVIATGALLAGTVQITAVFAVDDVRLRRVLSAPMSNVSALSILRPIEITAVPAETSARPEHIAMVVNVNVCLSLKYNPNNCGSCGNVCASGFCFSGACYDPPANAPVCQPKEVIVNGNFDNGMSPWTGPDSTGHTSGQIVPDSRSPPDSPNSLQIVLPASELRYTQFADIGQAIDICVNQRYRIRYFVRVERPNSFGGGCDVAVLVPGQQFVVQGIDIYKQEYTEVVVDFTSDQGVVTSPMFWQSILTSDGVNGRSTVTFRVMCKGGSTGGGLIRFDSISIAPI
ncbi:hypothetical protein TWF191_005818 [Orbilia oligospora]|uniref:Apple domain-containing protein n=1 Tax=Orbilia oligospora TaxID=2813651 RepID=A0A7C8QXL7_ORBOL|nr:hypothetical protein TWF191_005818 [Orbilia oligospora]